MASILRRDVRREVRADAPPPAPPATVLVRPYVLRMIGASSTATGDHETGGPLIGTVQRSWERASERLIVSILGTVGPGPAIRAGVSTVALGSHGDGERAASAIRWWRSITGLDLVHLGDWHKHPSGSPEPSAGDRTTAQRMACASRAPVWLTAIAVGEDRRLADVKTEEHVVRLRREWASCQEVRFYRETGRAGLVRVAIRVEPAAIPRLPALPWHITDPVRFAVECRLLQAAGFRVAVDAATPGGRPGLWLRIRRDASGRSLTLTAFTDSRYPHAAPIVLDQRWEPLPLKGHWNPARFLADVVKEVG